MSYGWEIHGYTAPGFEPVAEAFRRNFSDGLELSAALAVFRSGEPLVDIWAGTADRRTAEPWVHDTVQTIASGTKGLVGMCMLLILDRGLIKLDVPVERYWPEFGKPEIRVRDVVSHTARLPGIASRVISPDVFLDELAMGKIMAEEPISLDPRAAFTYHVTTIGWICSELIRRVTGKPVSQFFRDELAEPLRLDLWIGLPESHESRAAWLETDPSWGTLGGPIAEPNDNAVRDTLFWSQWHNPSYLTPSTFPEWNTRAFRAGKVPAINGVGSARSIAQLYSEIAGQKGKWISSDTLALAQEALSQGFDTMTGEPRRHSVVFQLDTGAGEGGPGGRGFGHGSGDDVIQFVGDTIQNAVRTTDKVARFGGEEFVVLLRETSLQDAALLAERIREQICKSVIDVRNDRVVNVTVSIGLSLARQEDRDIADVIERADRALYLAKTTGRNRVKVDLQTSMSNAA